MPPDIDWKKECAEAKNMALQQAVTIHGLLTQLSEKDTRIGQLEHSCSMACESPSNDCDCCGCQEARAFALADVPSVPQPVRDDAWLIAATKQWQKTTINRPGMAVIDPAKHGPQFRFLGKFYDEWHYWAIENDSQNGFSIVTRENNEHVNAALNRAIAAGPDLSDDTSIVLLLTDLPEYELRMVFNDAGEWHGEWDCKTFSTQGARGSRNQAIIGAWLDKFGQ